MNDSPTPEAGRDLGSEIGHDLIAQNIAAVHEFTEREEQKISRVQRILERISHFIGRPLFFGLVLLFVALWTLASLLVQRLGGIELDPPPFHWLQGLTGLAALLATNVVLSKQNRLARLADQRAHLDLKVALLTEQKVAKLIDLIEELRRDLPDVKNRHDSGAAALQQAMNPDLVLAALDEAPVQDKAPRASVGPGADASPAPATAVAERT